jgi:hypothetical protein
MARNSNQVGSFVPTTNVWDTAQIEASDLSPTAKELLVRLYQNINNIALVLNTKESGYYDTNQFVTGSIFYPNPANNSQTSPYKAAIYRQVNRKVIIFGALPNTGTKSVPHGITVTPHTTWVTSTAEATDPIGLQGIFLPYASPILANNIEINVDSTNVNITTGSNRSNFTICNVTLEFLIN